MLISSTVLLATKYYYLAPVPALGVFAILATLKWPKFLYYLVIALIPFGAFRTISEDLPFLRLHWIASFLLLLAAAYWTLPKRRLPDRLSCNLWNPMLLFLAINCIAASFSSYPALAFKNVLLIVVGYFVFFGMTLFFVDRDGFERILPRVIVASVALSGGLGVLGYFFNIDLFTGRDEMASSSRGTGGVEDPNNMALYVIYTVPFLIHWVARTTSKGKSLFFLLLLGNATLAIVSTYSRGGALVFAITAFLTLFEHRKHIPPRKLGLLLSGFMVAIALALLVIPQSYWERQGSLASEEDVSLSRRASYLMVAWESIQQSPLVGFGPGTFRELYGRSEVTLQYKREGHSLKRDAHNTFVEVLIGSGVPGFAVFLWMIFLAIRNLGKTKRMYREKGQFVLADLTGAYRQAFFALLLYLCIFSDVFHKFLLLSLAASQVGMYAAKAAPDVLHTECSTDELLQTSETTETLS
ncbi:O-antigen ligase family protein [Desulfovibrio inopinatus]|uniref:O-antigen ligase family protein n=1 Tax=Desulfovibrio inopinatus TaxID=102109 RepID=UPI00146FBD38|nr:O-antigen ligase family protein [Desulfovibrio inopinatus]